VDEEDDKDECVAATEGAAVMTCARARAALKGDAKRPREGRGAASATSKFACSSDEEAAKGFFVCVAAAAAEEEEAAGAALLPATPERVRVDSMSARGGSLNAVRGGEGWLRGGTSRSKRTIQQQ
jgi:hypothetical protein